MNIPTQAKPGLEWATRPSSCGSGAVQSPCSGPAEGTAQAQATQKAQKKPPSQAVFYDANMKRKALPVGTQVLLTDKGTLTTNPVGTKTLEVPYSAAVVTNTGVKPLNTPTEIQMQERETSGTIKLGCQVRCSNKSDSDDYNGGRFTDTISIGSGNAFRATQNFYFGTSGTPATLVMELSPGYYASGNSTDVAASANSVVRKIE